MEKEPWKSLPNDDKPPEKLKKQLVSIRANRMPLRERVGFSVGHVLNDLVVAAWVSYILIVQTKVIGLSPKTSGYIWVVVSVSDCFGGLAVGSVCDHVRIPWFSERYGQKKTWHLIGALTVASTFPFLMMPCLYCAGDTDEWKLAVYYSFIFVIFITAWDMVQTTHTTLIPEIARRPSEIVELNASRFGCTYASGIVMYSITWVLLGEDSQDNLSRNQWKDFMYLSVIIVGVGLLCCLVFYIGTKEVSHDDGSPLEDYELYKGAMRRTASALLPLQSLAGDLFPFEGNTKRASFFSEANPSHRPLDSEYETKRRSFFGELFRGRDLESYTLIPGPDCSDDGLSVDRKCCLDQAPNEQYPSPWVKRADASLYVGASGHSAKKMKMKQRPTIPSPYKQSAVVVNNHKCVTLLVELREKCHSVLFPGNQTVSPTDKEGTTQMISSSRQESLEEDIHTSSSTISSGVVTDCPILDTSVRRSYRSHTTSSTDSGASMEEGKETTSFLKFDALDPQAEWNLSMNRPKPVTSIQVRPPSWGVECQELKLAIEPELGSCAGMEPKHMDEKPRSLREWFTYPTFYKVSFAFMCTRVVENTMYAYFPLYVVDTLKMGKAAIAYLPLVVLISGLFASVAAKRLNKVLGSKWTYCMACLVVMAASAWFYLMPLFVKDVVYVPACLLGGGCCVMLVTSMALIAEMLKDNKMSSATVFNSTTLFAKVANGATVALTQQFYPQNSLDEGASGVYVKHAFAVVLGIAALSGLLAVVMFLPASVKCKRVVETSDASTQT